MAERPDNDINVGKEIKYLRGVLSQVDGEIELPEKLRGRNMLHKLDGIEQSEPPKKFWTKSRFLSWEAAAVYAIAAALTILVVRTGVINSVDGSKTNVPIVDTPGQVMVPDIYSTPGTEAPETTEPGQTAPEQSGGDAVQPDSPETQGGQNPVQDGSTTTPTPGTQGSGTAGKPVENWTTTEPGGVGGGGEIKTLGEFEKYTFIIRKNDPNDPDKKDYPLTLEVVEEGKDEIYAQVDLTGMIDVTTFMIDEGYITLIGKNDKDMTVVSTYKGFYTQDLAMTGQMAQPGLLLTYQMRNGYAYVVTNLKEVPYGWITSDTNEIAIGDSTESGYGVLTAMRNATGEGEQITIRGTNGGGIELNSGHMVIEYEDYSGEERRAKVTFRGTRLEYEDAK